MTKILYVLVVILANGDPVRVEMPTMALCEALAQEVALKVKTAECYEVETTARFVSERSA